MNLFFRKSGQGQPLLILHGLFGSSDNWYSLSKVFAEQYTVYTLDQRNHGQSPHSDAFDYKILAQDLENFLLEQNIENPIVIGHSMGGKTAMNLAIKNPSLIEKLIVVDIAPKPYPIHHDHILDGLTAIPLESIHSRSEAEVILAEYVDEADVRQFLLKNLSRNSEGKFVWRINLPAIDKHIEDIGTGMQFEGTYIKPTLFIKGARSGYFKEGDDEKILQYFPTAQIVTVDTGHWVQAENPKVFVEVVNNFLK
ncbi:MAG: alpha/beta fold hydrolase [Flammeovirgaceae bacterium]